MKRKKSRVAVETLQTAFRLRPVELKLLDEARRRQGVTSRAEAFRNVIREWAECKGIDVAEMAQEKP